jgi:sugar lactone lactonase YvrE
LKRVAATVTSTKALPPHEFVPVVEGRVFMERTDGEPPKPVTMGSDGIAISSDGERLWYCPLASRRWYSVSTKALLDRSLSDEQVAATVVDQGDKGGGADGLESDDQGRLYATNYEHNAILRRMPDGEDLRGYPYWLFRVAIHAGPVLLR